MTKQKSFQTTTIDSIKSVDTVDLFIIGGIVVTLITVIVLFTTNDKVY